MWEVREPFREVHTESGLRCYLSWYAERGLDPMAAQRPHLELSCRASGRGQGGWR